MQVMYCSPRSRPIQKRSTPFVIKKSPTPKLKRYHPNILHIGPEEEKKEEAGA
jgi:hypothetical protein